MPRVDELRRRHSSGKTSPRIAERTQLHRSTPQNLAEVVTSGVKLRASMNSEPTKMSLVKHGKSTDSEVRISNVSDTIKVIKTGPGELVKPGNEGVVNRKKTSLVGVKRLPLLPRSQNFSTKFQEGGTSIEINFSKAENSSNIDFSDGQNFIEIHFQEDANFIKHVPFKINPNRLLHQTSLKSYLFLFMWTI